MRGKIAKQKTLEQSKKICRQVREKKTRVIASLSKFTEIIEAECLLKKLPEDIKAARKVIEDNKGGFTDVYPQLEEKSAYNDKLKKDIDEKDAKLVSLKSEVSQLKSNVERLEGKTSAIEELKKKIDQLGRERDGVEYSIKGLIPEVESLKNETSSLQAKLVAGKEELQKLGPEKEQLNKDIAELSDKIKAAGELDVKKNELAGVIAENNQITERINEIVDGLDQDDQLKSKLNSDIDGINEQVESISREVDGLKDKDDSLSKTVIPKEEVDKLQIQLDAVIKERDDLNDKTTKMEKEIEENMKSKGDIIKEVENAGAELETLRDEFNKFKERIDLYENDPQQLERLKNKIPDSEKIVFEYVKKCKNSKDELRHLNNAVDIMSTESISYKEAMEEISNLLG